jgi:hypothetical protein
VIALPILEEGCERDLGRDPRDREDFALLGGLNSVGQHLVGARRLYLSESGHHRLDDAGSHLGRLLDQVFEAADLEGRETEPDIGHRRLVRGLDLGGDDSMLLRSIGDAAEPGAVAAIEEDHRVPCPEPHDADEIVGLVAAEVERNPGLERTIDVHTRQ